jgi:hypothetical protein
VGNHLGRSTHRRHAYGIAAGVWSPHDFSPRARLSVSTAGAPDQLREKTAEETAAVKPNDPGRCRRESKTSRAVSVRLTEPMNHDLTSLRAITPPPADRFIAARPYGNSHQFVSGQIVSGDEPAKIPEGVVEPVASVPDGT